MTQKRIAISACLCVAALYFAPVIGLGFFKVGLWPIKPEQSIQISIDVRGSWLPIGASGQLNHARFVGDSHRTVAYARTSALSPWKMEFAHVSALDARELATAVKDAAVVGTSPWGEVLHVNRFVPATSQLYVIPDIQLMIVGEAHTFIRDIHAIGGVVGSASLQDVRSVR